MKGYKSIDLTQLNGLATYQDTLDFMQKGIVESCGAIAAAFGNLVVLSGCVDNGTGITDGWMAVNGEILPFVGGPKGATPQIIIEELTDTEVFADTVVRTVYYTRRARIGVTGGIDYATLKRADQMFMPKGGIIMWSGTIAAIPTGWALCDGANGTPNLSGKFIVGYAALDVDYNAIGNQGGEKKHTLIKDELPPINVAIPQGDSYTGGGPVGRVGRGSNAPADINIGVGGTSKPFENRPPYYTLAYIIKL
jgi:hypothetical protein